MEAKRVCDGGEGSGTRQVPLIGQHQQGTAGYLLVTQLGGGGKGYIKLGPYPTAMRSLSYRFTTNATTANVNTTHLRSYIRQIIWVTQITRMQITL